MHANGPFEDGIDLGGHIETIPAYWDGFWKHCLTHNGVKQWLQLGKEGVKVGLYNLETFQMHANCPFEDGIVLGGHIAETIPAYWDGFWKHWLTHNGVKQCFKPETGAITAVLLMLMNITSDPSSL